ncbi:MAG: tyrosine-type recombinase/integrase [Dechloromonas sp.]|nr:tyrosine-type recombinase/integrase [Dechloromonas sp.]
MRTIPPLRDKVTFDSPLHTVPSATAQRTNRRRLTVFLIVFTLSLLPGLAWNLLRAPEYRASARVQITAGTVSSQTVTNFAGSSAELPTAQKMDLLNQAQILTSRPLAAEVLRRLDQAGYPAAFAGADPVVALQNAVAATPIPETDIVELQAIGASPQLMAKVVNTLIETYHEQSLASHGNRSQEAIVNLRDEVERLGVSIAGKRSQLAAFRERSGVVSSERSENEALARIKGLSESLNKVNEDAAKADARLRTLRESAASGRSPVLSKDNPTLASIEQRISATREQLRDMERTYTPAFMAMDPTARALRARLAELEQQLVANRSSSQQSALTSAEEEAAGARAAVERLRGQIEGQRRAAQVFSGNFQEAKAMEEDLVRLEGARRNASERLAKLEATENTRLPSLRLIEAASVPEKPWRPDYLRDGLINLAGSFLLGLLAMWFIELFNRPPPAQPVGPTTVVVPQPWLTPALTAEQAGAAPRLAFDSAPGTVPQLAGGVSLPRELIQEEVGALLAATDGEVRLLCAVLLLGLTVDEVKELTVKDVDPESLRLTVRGASARKLALPGWLVLALQQHAGDDPDRPLFCDSLGQPLGASEVVSRITCAAFDAGLDEAASVSPEALRHTYILNLVHQNVRFSDLGPLVGHLSTNELAAYAAVSSGPRQVRGAEVDPIMPALLQPEMG